MFKNIIMKTDSLDKRNSENRKFLGKNLIKIFGRRIRKRIFEEKRNQEN